jgi:hypothetical protein
MSACIGRTIAYAVILIVAWLASYNLGYHNGRFDLIREPTREAYVHMGWGYDENETPTDSTWGTALCWKHLDGNGEACAPRKCRPNCYVTNWFRGIKFND